MGGFQPRHARGKPAQIQADDGSIRGFKAGGLIRGPGSGTSDSIKTDKAPGTFIMPADSTQAIGPGALEGLGEKVPVSLSNGEFELPPEQVQALGEAVLTVMRNATHAPHDGGASAHGFVPRQAFAGGGVVQDQENARAKRAPGAVPGAPALGAYAPGTRGAQLVAAEEQKAKDRAATGKNLVEASSAAGKAIVDAINAPFGKGSAPATPSLTAPAAPQAPSTPNANDVRLAAGTVASPGAMAAARGSATPPKPAAPVSMTGAPQQQAGQTQPFDFDTFEPAPGEGAFRNEQTGEVTRLQTVPSGTQIWKPQQQAPAAPAGFVPPSQRQGVRAPVLNPNGGVFSSMVDFTNQAGQAVQAIAANKGMRNDRKDALDQQRVGLDAASTFAKIEQGDRALGIDGRRADTAQDLAALQADELGLKREAAGFQTRAAKRLEGLQTALMAEQDPSKRAAIARQIQELSGKGEGNLRDNFMAVGGGQEWDAQAGVMRNVPQRLVDLRNGQEVGGQQAPAAPAAAPGAAPAQPKNKAEYDALPKGAQYIKNGITYTKG